jgi:hypothetical protein
MKDNLVHREYLGDLKGLIYRRRDPNFLGSSRIIDVAVTHERNGFVVWTGAFTEDLKKMRINCQWYPEREEAIEVAVWRFNQMKKENGGG